jgi:hypothetical protein
MSKQSQLIRQTASALLVCGLITSLLPGFAIAQNQSTSAVAIIPLDGPVLAGKPVTFKLSGNPSNPHWKLGDGATAEGSSVSYTFEKPGIYRVVMGSKVGDTFNELSSAIVRVHTPETVHLPQVILDTDAANEIDDQHAIAYALFSELDVLAITTITWIGWKDQKKQTEPFVDWCGEAASYSELMKVLDLAKQSGLPASRVPMVFRGAKQPFRYLGLTSDTWFNTQPVITDASNAILAAARGASPDNPVWVLPVGPLGNVASALLQARQQGWATEFSRRIRVCWLGGGPDGASTHANGGRDPWAPWVTYKATVEIGTEFVMFLERPTGVSIAFDEATDYDLYPSNPLGDYLKRMTTNYINRWRGEPRATPKGMYDLGVLSYVIGEHLGRPWLTRVEPSILHPQSPFKPERTTGPTNLDVVHEIDVPAMKKNFWDTLNGKPTALPPKKQ